MTRKVVIVGTSLFAEVVHCYFTELGAFDVVAFTADRAYVTRDSFLGLPLIPFDSIAARFPPGEFGMFVAVGYARLNQVRARLYSQAKVMGYELVSFVHPSVRLWRNNTVGDNTFLFEDNTVQPFARIGSNTVLWSGNHIGHHSVIGDHCFITSHVVVSGNCRVGDYTFIGVNATLRDSIEIGQSNVIGAGALIMKSTLDKELHVAPRTKADTRSTDDIEM